jgi:hypothetical protein
LRFRIKAKLGRRSRRAGIWPSASWVGTNVFALGIIKRALMYLLASGEAEEKPAA